MDQELLGKYASTVFLCDTTQDGKYIRCDFQACSKHKHYEDVKLIPVSYWLLNTAKNVQYLEKHVSDEIDQFMSQQLQETKDSSIYDVNEEYIHPNQAKHLKKLVVVFNLRDRSANLASWMDSFIKVVQIKLGNDDLATGFMALSFSSRKELVQKMTRLNSIVMENSDVEFVLILSCHSSSQGQVFSCTPHTISKLYHFEEFCSIHDFVQCCQHVLNEQLKVIHISSCFALKLDESHKDWPVDFTWYATDLKCLLSGSAKEVYETGSQTADLFLVLSTLFKKSECSLELTFKDSHADACMNLFPDLVKEMGLCTLNGEIAHLMMENSEKEDQVSHSKPLESSIFLLVITDIQEVNLTLKNGIFYNLQTRIFAESQNSCASIEINDQLFDETCRWKAALSEHLSALTIDKLKVFVVVLGANLNTNVSELLSILIAFTKNRDITLYGVHLNDLNTNTLVILKENCYNVPMTYFPQCGDDESRCVYELPVLVYLVHLSLGENALFKGSCSTLLHTKDWSFRDVYEEVVYVLNGLCGKSKLNFIADTDVITLSKLEYKKKDKSKNCIKNDEDKSTNTSQTISSNENQVMLKLGDASSNFDDPMHNNIHSNDLPLMANVNEVLVYHYALDLDINFPNNSIDGNILLFVKAANEVVASQRFQLCLDCTLIDILFVKEVQLSNECNIHFQSDSPCCKETNEEGTSAMCPTCLMQQTYSKGEDVNDLNYKTLTYATYGWCIRIWKDETISLSPWPKCVWIRYKTKPSGPSLTWCDDQDGKPCCFTPGAYINNRSMMPCQEPPIAMATWQATIKVPKDMVSLSSGDTAGRKQNCLRAMFPSDNTELFYFEMSVPLPSSTLAFAFGSFSKSVNTITCDLPENDTAVEVSLYAPRGMIRKFDEEYLLLASRYLKCASKLLGKYPFSRLDVVVMPKCFACMGLSSPNIVFLSQSVLCGNQSMSTRVAHEISHAWFGLLVGVKDWTEEWLSEGFATYIEDRILAVDQNMSLEEFSSYSTIMKVLRLKTLKSEIQQVDDDNLKLLRPRKKTNYVTAKEAINESMKIDYVEEIRPFSVVPNAAIASKKFSQIHYLKGYFLLHHLVLMVGVVEFDNYLKHYLQVYANKLVTSEMFFNLFIDYFKLERNLKDELINVWLDESSLPMASIKQQQLQKSPLIDLVNAQFMFWKNENSTNKRCRSRGTKRKRNIKSPDIQMSPPQLVLLLEKLLELNEIAASTFTQLNNAFNFSKRNAEIRHRWCELVIKHMYIRKYDDVSNFLINDQGMGVYLFGELMINGNKRQEKLANEIFDQIKLEMDRSTYQTVYELLHPIND